MGLSFTVGGTRGTFDDRLAAELAGVLDDAYGGEREWEGSPPRHYGELIDPGWLGLLARADATLGREMTPNLHALGLDGRGGVYLPTQTSAVSLPLVASGGTIRCASLPGLRRELADLAESWEVALDDDSLIGLLRSADDAPVAVAPEVIALARLALAANEAVRRGCPLWLVG